MQSVQTGKQLAMVQYTRKGHGDYTQSGAENESL